MFSVNIKTRSNVNTYKRQSKGKDLKTLLVKANALYYIMNSPIRNPISRVEFKHRNENAMAFTLLNSQALIISNKKKS